MSKSSSAPGALSGLVVLDLSRILAGPTCTQILGDLGAEVLKVERPGRGDDTRGWGPPFLKDGEGNETAESAYYLSSNRNKASLAIDLAAPEGQKLIADLAEKADILVENFKVGDLKRRGLDYETLKARNPKLIYCSISGFGQTGPYAQRAGYDFIAQGMGGIMSLTGFPDEEGGTETKCGTGIADVMCGMYAAVSILAALNHRNTTGEGQSIDISLLDAQVSWLINQGVAYLISGEVPGRIGNGHPAIVPYETFPAADRSFILAVGNDTQFEKFCAIAGAPELAADPLYARNADRVRNRKQLIPLIRRLTIEKTAAEWISLLETAGVPCGPVNDLADVFADPQVLAREMRISLPHPLSGGVDLIGSPINLEKTPVSYRSAPPVLGADTANVLSRLLGLDEAALSALAEKGIVDLGASAGQKGNAAK
ncbi:CaiB/BaiF CoA transferase family protein [Roseibium marinum]|uniref:Crotonobetainyl-CoA:carnitine CoA-transferase CaiB-like acyl-CoA transferase n=1 Tax=Roseibium marinum TaxID=281252 RepID=A0A2S3V2N6_9HYPH|nr:CaiB/BaiF CoA-transferase family protein [Roseibium marinum]POF34206.1 crotonobetainyl-CoA:carnitine CoA-transferase CaiB-like acyl-CoA transferase [Roseibium marinum]